MKSATITQPANLSRRKFFADAATLTAAPLLTSARSAIKPPGARRPDAVLRFSGVEAPKKA